MNINEMAQGAPAQDQAAGGTGGATGATTPATPEQQAQFDMLLGRARQMMGESAAEWKAALEINPAGAAVQLGTRTLRFLAQESEKSGQPVDPAVLLHAGIQLVKDIAGVANDAGLVPDERLESFLQDVMQQSLAEYMRMDAEDGLLPRPEDLRQKAMPGGPQQPPATAPRGINLAQMAQRGGAR